MMGGSNVWGGGTKSQPDCVHRSPVSKRKENRNGMETTSVYLPA